MAPDRMNQTLLEFAFQYYVVSRFGVRARLSPVTGNLFHHARSLTVARSKFAIQVLPQSPGAP